MHALITLTFLAQIALAPEAMVWKDGPPTLPPGTKVAVLEGDPNAEGMFTMRIRVPAGSKIPPHWHPRDERVTVLSGVVELGFGKNVKRYPAGSFYVNPPRSMHFLFFPEDTEIQLTGLGPWKLHTADVSIRIMKVTPLPGSVVTAETKLTVEVAYDIRNFQPETFALSLQFETPTANQTFTAGRTGDNMLTAATGTYTVEYVLSRVWGHPMVRQPIRFRVFVHDGSRIAGMSEWVAFR
jgi:quercetin dioxygenase-like cupin family protein